MYSFRVWNFSSFRARLRFWKFFKDFYLCVCLLFVMDDFDVDFDFEDKFDVNDI